MKNYRSVLWCLVLFLPVFTQSPFVQEFSLEDFFDFDEEEVKLEAITRVKKIASAEAPPFIKRFKPGTPETVCERVILPIINYYSSTQGKSNKVFDSNNTLPWYESASGNGAVQESVYTQTLQYITTLLTALDKCCDDEYDYLESTLFKTSPDFQIVARNLSSTLAYYDKQLKAYRHMKRTKALVLLTEQTKIARKILIQLCRFYFDYELPHTTLEARNYDALSNFLTNMRIFNSVSEQFTQPSPPPAPAPTPAPVQVQVQVQVQGQSSQTTPIITTIQQQPITTEEQKIVVNEIIKEKPVVVKRDPQELLLETLKDIKIDDQDEDITQKVNRYTAAILHVIGQYSYRELTPFRKYLFPFKEENQQLFANFLELSNACRKRAQTYRHAKQTEIMQELSQDLNDAHRLLMLISHYYFNHVIPGTEHVYIETFWVPNHLESVEQLDYVMRSFKQWNTLEQEKTTYEPTEISRTVEDYESFFYSKVAPALLNNAIIKWNPSLHRNPIEQNKAINSLNTFTGNLVEALTHCTEQELAIIKSLHFKSSHCYEDLRRPLYNVMAFYNRQIKSHRFVPFTQEIKYIHAKAKASRNNFIRVCRHFFAMEF